MSEIILPRVFEDKTGKYPQHEGKPKLSYSQYTSFNDPLYMRDYIKSYFIGVRNPSGVFALAGSDAGEYIEWKGNGGVGDKPTPSILTEDSIKLLDDIVDYPDNCVYEDLIVLDLGDFVVEGYIDRARYTEEGIYITDFKTGNIKTKAEYYASSKYRQTILYAYAKHVEGHNILGTDVELLGRKGNGRPNSPIRLDGTKKTIPIDFTPELGKAFSMELKRTALKISKLYTQYLKIFG